MGNARRVIVVAAVVVLAGCSSPASPQTRTATATATAAPVPTDAPSTFLAPGVTPRGVVNPVALVTAHRRTLRGTNVTVRVEASRRYANGSLRWRRTATQRIDAAGGPVRSHYVGEFAGTTPAAGLPPAFVRFPDAARVERYTYGDGAYHRYRLRSGGTWYVGGTSSGVRPLDPGLVVLFRAVETRVVGREMGTARPGTGSRGPRSSIRRRSSGPSESDRSRTAGTSPWRPPSTPGGPSAGTA